MPLALSFRQLAKRVDCPLNNDYNLAVCIMMRRFDRGTESTDHRAQETM